MGAWPKGQEAHVAGGTSEPFVLGVPKHPEFEPAERVAAGDGRAEAITRAMLTVMLLTPAATDLARAQSLSTPADASGPGSPTPARDEAAYTPPAEVKTLVPQAREDETRDGMRSRWESWRSSESGVPSGTCPQREAHALRIAS